MPDFWQMALEERTRVIIMLTREQEERCNFPKCDRYWPDPGQCVRFGSHFVFGLEERTDAASGTIVRKFRVAKARSPPGADASPITPSRPAGGLPACDWGGETDTAFQTPVRRPPPRDSLVQEVPYAEAADTLSAGHADIQSLTQIQYVDWPDQTVPETANTLLQLCASLDELMAPAAGEAPAGRPIIHCSAGVGRTGTFIGAHKALRAMQAAFVQATGEQIAPMPTVHDIVADMKKERSKSVQTAEQYRFIYHALAEGLERYRERHRAQRDANSVEQ